MKTYNQFLQETIGAGVMYIVRGLPGSGKSTYARSLVSSGSHFEADQFFMKGGKYLFDPSKIKDAHADCLNRIRKAIESGKVKEVAVSNTFTQAWEMQSYIDLAKLHGWHIKIIRMSGNYGSIHGVPQDSIDRMKSRFENIAGEVLK